MRACLGNDPVVGCESFDCVFIGEPQRSEKPDHEMGSRKCLLEQAMLSGEWRHGRPMVIHVGNVMSLKDVQIPRTKNLGIADFCCVL